MKTKTGYIILGILFIIFSVIAFFIPTTKSTVFWASYLFGVLAIAFQIPLWNKALGKETLNSNYFSLPALQIGVIYLIVQIVFSICMMIIPNAPIWITIIISVVIFAIACILIISGGVAKTTIEKTEKTVQTKTAFIKSLKADVGILLAKETDPKVKTELNKLYDEIRYSDPMSNRALAEIEKQISEKIASIETADENKLNLISDIINLLKQRNIKCKALK